MSPRTVPAALSRARLIEAVRPPRPGKSRALGYSRSTGRWVGLGLSVLRGWELPGRRERLPPVERAWSSSGTGRSRPVPFGGSQPIGDRSDRQAAAYPATGRRGYSRVAGWTGRMRGTSRPRSCNEFRSGRAGTRIGTRAQKGLSIERPKSLSANAGSRTRTPCGTGS